MNKYLPYYLLLIMLGSSCTKFLDKKPSASLVVPSSTGDLQRLLDNISIMNTTASFLGEAMADNYYVTAADFNSLPSEAEKDIYRWGPAPFAGVSSASHDWARLYGVVYNANVVLDALAGIQRTASNADQWDYVRAAALFFRGKSHFEIAVFWAPAYTPATMENPGIPLRLNSDFNEHSVRQPLQRCMDQVLADLHESIANLSEQVLFVSRPSKAAGYGMLARVYLYKADYANALLYADSCLKLNAALLNYNDLNASAGFPVPPSIRAINNEVIFHNTAPVFTVTGSSRAKMDTVLLSSYASNDLRKSIFFSKNSNGSFGFKGSYNGNTTPFTGLVTDELFLIKAECLAKLNRVKEAMDVLNALLITRWKTGTYVPFVGSSQEQALQIILSERRKELVWRGLRFMDIKRLNIAGSGIVQKRQVDNMMFTLEPNVPYYALPIPEDVIQVTGMQQN